MSASSPWAAWPSNIVPFRLARMGDERLARLVSRGDQRAFAALYDRYHQSLYRYCSAIVRHESDAQDAFQSALARALTALRRGQRDAPVRPWLFRIAHNEAISVLRRRRPGEELSEACAPRAPSAEDEVLARERLATMVADLRELPERPRGALLMRELSGLSHEEIAIALGTSVGAAKQSIFDARRGLLEFAQGRAMACENVQRSISDGDGRVLRGRRVRSHLRHCPACAAFAAAIPACRAELRALAPGLSPAAAAATLAQVIGSTSAPGIGSGAVAAGAAGKTVAATLAAKTAVSAAVVITASAGAVGMAHLLAHAHAPGGSRQASSVLRPGRLGASATQHPAVAVAPEAAATTPHTPAPAGRGRGPRTRSRPRGEARTDARGEARTDARGETRTEAKGKAKTEARAEAHTQGSAPVGLAPVTRRPTHRGWAPIGAAPRGRGGPTPSPPGWTRDHGVGPLAVTATWRSSGAEDKIGEAVPTQGHVHGGPGHR